MTAVYRVADRILEQLQFAIDNEQILFGFVEF